MQVYNIYQLGLYKKMVQAFLFTHRSSTKNCAGSTISPFVKYDCTVLPDGSSPP